MNDAVRFDPAHNGYVYTYNAVSSDNGASWTSSGAALGECWTIDATGALYRVSSASGSFAVQRAADGRTPSFVSLTAITDTYSASSASLSVSDTAATIAVGTNGHAYLSTDGGATFPRLAPPADVGVAAKVVAVNETVAYGIDSGWNTYATTNAGLNWTLSAGGFPGHDIALLHTSETSPATVWVRAESYSATNDNGLMVTQNGFTSVKTYSNGPVNWESIGAVSLTDPNVFYVLGRNTYRTLDGGTSSTSKTTTIDNVYRGGMVGAVDPTDNNIVLFAGQVGTTNALYRYDYTANTITDWTARVGFAATTLEQYWQSGRVMLRVASGTGEVATSSDFGQSFGTRGPAAQSGGSCFYTRLLASAASNHDLVATGCPYGNDFAYSRNGGAAWTRSPALAGCQLHQLSVVASGVVVGCDDGHSTFMPF
jgi:hypothetical protein